MTHIWLRWFGRRWAAEPATLRDRLVAEVAQPLVDAAPGIDAELLHRQAEAVADAMLPFLEGHVAEETETLRAERDRLAGTVKALCSAAEVVLLDTGDLGELRTLIRTALAEPQQPDGKCNL